MNYRYSTGLSNMGPFQVSGRPWLKSESFTGVQSAFYEFPNVTDHIKITNDIAAAGTGNLDIVFCEPRRAIDMSNSSGASDYYLASISTTYAFSVAMWLKIDPALAVASTRYISIEGTDAELRVQMNTAPNDLRFLLFDKAGPTLLASDTFTQTLVQGQWIHMAITVSTSGDFKLYFDGVEKAAFNYAHVAGGHDFNSLLFGDNSGLTFEGFYDQISLFSSDLTADEVSQLYNDGKYYDPREYSGGANLLSLWDFEDNNYKTFYSTADTVATINDRIGSSNLVFQGGNNPAFTDGRLLENALERHKITLTGQEEIRLNCKSKQVFLRSTGNTDVNICAGLTSIPAQRMYELSGTGIDE